MQIAQSVVFVLFKATSVNLKKRDKIICNFLINIKIQFKCRSYSKCHCDQLLISVFLKLTELNKILNFTWSRLQSTHMNCSADERLRRKCLQHQGSTVWITVGAGKNEPMLLAPHKMYRKWRCCKERLATSMN